VFERASTRVARMRATTTTTTMQNARLMTCDFDAMRADVERFYAQCDPDKENLCLYGNPDGTWEVQLPAEEVPPELPEPALGINFARDGMQVRAMGCDAMRMRSRRCSRWCERARAGAGAGKYRGKYRARVARVRGARGDAYGGVREGAWAIGWSIARDVDARRLTGG